MYNSAGCDLSSMLECEYVPSAERTADERKIEQVLIAAERRFLEPFLAEARAECDSQWSRLVPVLIDYQCGLSLKSITKQYGISQSQVSRLVKRLGIERLQEPELRVFADRRTVAE